MKLTTFSQVVLALSLVGAGGSSAKEHSTMGARGEVQMRHRKMAGQARDNLELG
jgi:hypothetical protein